MDIHSLISNLGRNGTSGHKRSGSCIDSLYFCKSMGNDLSALEVLERTDSDDSNVQLPGINTQSTVTMIFDDFVVGSWYVDL